MLAWPNPNRSNRRSAVQWYFPLQSKWVFSAQWIHPPAMDYILSGWALVVYPLVQQRISSSTFNQDDLLLCDGYICCWISLCLKLTWQLNNSVFTLHWLHDWTYTCLPMDYNRTILLIILLKLVKLLSIYLSTAANSNQNKQEASWTFTLPLQLVFSVLPFHIESKRH